jgi:hypothetical protein
MNDFEVMAPRLVKYLNNAIITARISHWNVRGQLFFQYHLLFERVYNELSELMDTMVEQLRALGHSPTFQEFSGPGIDVPGYDPETLVNLTLDYLMSLQGVFTAAFEFTEENEDPRLIGFGDFLQSGLQTMLQLQYLLTAELGF